MMIAPGHITFAALSVLAVAAVQGQPALAQVPAIAVQNQLEPMDIAVLQGLDKITGRIAEFEVPVNYSSPFGSLRVSVRACHKAPPTEEPESAAFLEVHEVPPGEEKSLVRFSGWMYASSPGVSALQHPVYDVWVKDCRKRETSSDEHSPGDAPR